jgi:hypothetical protein
MLRSIIAELFRAARHTEEDGGELLVDTLRRTIDKQIVGSSNGILLRRQGDGISEACPCSNLPVRIRGVLQYQQKALTPFPSRSILHCLERHPTRYSFRESQTS